VIESIALPPLLLKVMVYELIVQAAFSWMVSFVVAV
jgi:hypothetical protein